jgi:hypothetical protein
MATYSPLVCVLVMWRRSSYLLGDFESCRDSLNDIGTNHNM